MKYYVIDFVEPINKVDFMVKLLVIKIKIYITYYFKMYLK